MPRSALPLAVQPQRGGGIAVVQEEIGGIVLHRRLTGAGEHPAVQIHIVLLCRRIALNVEDALLARRQVRRPPLLHDHRRERGVVDVAAVARLVGDVRSVQHAIRLPARGKRPHRQTLVLPDAGRRDIRAKLLELQLRVDPDVFKVALHQLRGIDEVGARASRHRELRFPALGNTGLREQTPCLLGVVPVVCRPLAELIHGQGPLDQAAGDGGGRFAPELNRLDDGLPIDGVGEGAADPHVSERRLIGTHGEHSGEEGQEIWQDPLGVTFLQGCQVVLADGPPALWAAVELPRAVHGQPRRRVVEDQPFHPVHPGQVLDEVVRVASEDGLHVRFVALQEEGTGADGALGFLQVAVVLDDFRGDDPHALVMGEEVEEPDERFFQEETHGIAIDDLNPVHRVEQIAVSIPLFRQEAIEAEFHILRHQLTPVEGRLVLPLHPVAEMEDNGRVVQSFPVFGHIRINDQGARRNPSPDSIPHQLAVDKAQRRMGLEVAAQMRVKMRRVLAADTEDTAALRWPRFLSSGGGEGCTGHVDSATPAAKPA